MFNIGDYVEIEDYMFGEKRHLLSLTLGLEGYKKKDENLFDEKRPIGRIVDVSNLHSNSEYRADIPEYRVDFKIKNKIYNLLFYDDEMKKPSRFKIV